MTSPAPNSDQRRVLVVDDDPAIRAAYEEVLASQGYDVLSAGSRTDALAALERVQGKVDALVLDIGLPDADGSDVATASAELYGSRPTLYVTGWTDEFWQLSEAPGPWMVLRKPIPIPRLLAAIKWLIEGGPKPTDLG